MQLLFLIQIYFINKLINATKIGRKYGLFNFEQIDPMCLLVEFTERGDK